jgi:hypothetical protein
MRISSRRRSARWLVVVVLAVSFSLAGRDEFVPSPRLRVGVAVHAFDHLGAIGHQAEAAAAAGATLIYAGFGGAGYNGLPSSVEFKKLCQDEAAYVRTARKKGIEIAIGYICATSIVGLETFDKNWTPEFRAQFKSAPTVWRQQDRTGRPLPSWYGGAYQPACMNNPDWRAYERFMVRATIEAGYDGIFFDNPTVHPDGCYCLHCMEKFAKFLESEGRAPTDRSLEAVRRAAEAQPRDFKRFRATVAPGFLAEMRAFARSLKRDALVTCNNSLNAPEALFSQIRTYGYDISRLSRAEDYVLVEDMKSQPRVLEDGRVVEYGPTYALLQAIGHGRPLAAVTIADDDYHTPPNLIRLAMAEAAANRASYVLWAAWPEAERPKMIAAVRPQVDLLRRHAALLNETRPRRDVALFLPYRGWVDGDRCAASELAAELVRRNIPFEAVSDEGFATDKLAPARVLLVESLSVLTPAEAVAAREFENRGGKLVAGDEEAWLDRLTEVLGQPSLTVDGPSTLRAYVHDQPDRTIVHLLNLNVRRLSSFEDEVMPTGEVRVRVRVPFAKVGSVTSHSADEGTAKGRRAFVLRPFEKEAEVEFTVDRLDIAAIIEITR